MTTKVCRPVNRQVCADADSKTLVPSCVPAARKRCVISPSESCQNVPKRQCFKVPVQVKRRVCNGGGSSGGNSYSSDSNDGY